MKTNIQSNLAAGDTVTLKNQHWLPKNERLRYNVIGHSGGCNSLVILDRGGQLVYLPESDLELASV